MPDLHLQRDLPIAVADLWRFITTPEGLLSWWGPEGMTVPEHALDFTRTGPWFSVMVGSAGQRHKVSGEVTSVRDGQSVGFTWAWHDEADQRGPESHVTLSIAPLGVGRSRLTLNHVDLPEGAGDAHEEGWTSCLRKLERQFATA